MKKLLLSLLCAGLMGMALPAASQAEDLDMGKITCKDLKKLDKNEMAMMVFWLDGYLSQKKNDTTMDEAWIDELTDKIAAFCNKNPDKPVIQSIAD